MRKMTVKTIILFTKSAKNVVRNTVDFKIIFREICRAMAKIRQICKKMRIKHHFSTGMLFRMLLELT